MVVTFSVTNMFQIPNLGSSDNGNSRHLIPDSPIFTSFHFMISVDLNAQGDDPVSYKVCAHRTECTQMYDSYGYPRWMRSINSCLYSMAMLGLLDTIQIFDWHMHK